MAPSHHIEAPPLRRRRKVAESCKLCRRKKTRCDGLRPSCSRCLGQDVACEYNDVTVTVQASLLKGLEDRLRKLENRAHPAIPAADGSAVPISTGITSENIDSRQIDYLSPASFVNHSSAQAIRDLTRIADGEDDSLTGLADLPYGIEGNPMPGDYSLMVLPERAVADDLVRSYSTNVHPLFPILHMPSFMERYEALWDRAGPKSLPWPSKVTFYATLNVVFASGCLNSGVYEPARRLSTAWGFYCRAKSLLPLDAIDAPAMEVVQYLLLTTHYLTYTKYTNRCRNTLAVAIRTALSAGLHTDQMSSSAIQLTREMSRRMWHHCQVFESLICSMLGQAPMLDTGYTVKLPESIGDEFLLVEGLGVQPPTEPCIVDAFIATAKLFELMQKFRKDISRSSNHNMSLYELTEVLKINSKIQGIEDNLPPHLRYDRNTPSTNSQNRELHLQAEAVMTRVLYVRLVVLQPCMNARARKSLLQSSPDGSGARPETTDLLWTDVCRTCVETACLAISIIHQNLRSSPRIFSCMAVYPTLLSATVIVSASMIPELDVELTDSRKPYQTSLNHAIEILENHRWQLEGIAFMMESLRNFITTANRVQQRRRDAQKRIQEAGTEGVRGFSLDLEDIIADIDFDDPMWDIQSKGLTSFGTATAC